MLNETVRSAVATLVAILRDGLLATIKRHVESDPDKVTVKMDRAAGFSTSRSRATRPLRRVGAALSGEGDGGMTLIGSADGDQLGSRLARALRP
jgi:hypothetical protein